MTKKDKDTKGKKGPKDKKSEKEKFTEMEDKYKRALADYQNLLKRSANEKSAYIKYAQEEFILKIIPVYDNLKTAMAHSGNESEDNNWLKGVEYIIKQFKEVLGELGVVEIETDGKEFDPNTMEAVEGKGDVVKKTVKTGYMLKEKVIVPARVALG